MKKNKVLFVLTTNKFSGAENVAITIIENMKDDFDFAYSSPYGDISKNLSKRKIKFFSMKKLSIFELKKVIKDFNPDIIHAHDYRASFLCSLVKGNRILISHLHNNAPWIKRISINSLVFLFFAKRSNKVLIVSNSIQEEFIFSKKIKSKFLCVDNPVSCSKVLDSIDNKKTVKNIDVCCVARVSSAKNPFKFLDIIAELKKRIPDIKCVWVGDNDNISGEEISNKISDLNINNNVEFVGFKDNPYEYMAKSKVFLLTSDWEGYGLVAFEALTVGLPCVVSKVGGLINIVNDDCGKLCDIDNIKDYYDEIYRLLSNKSYYQKKSKNAVMRAYQLQNISFYCNKLKEIYDDCLGEGK